MKDILFQKRVIIIDEVLLTSGTKGKRYAFLDSLIIPTQHIIAQNADGIYYN